MFTLLFQVTSRLSSYDATVLAMVKPKKHQRLADLDSQLYRFDSSHV